MKPIYEILTWDADEEEFTPQFGVPQFVEGWRGLLRAVRRLREHGYTAHRLKNNSDSDSSVLIERVEQPT